MTLQIANEVNLTVSPDSSDGSFEGARAALVEGVIAAKDEAARRGHDRLEIGFNWAYRTDPASEDARRSPDATGAASPGCACGSAGALRAACSTAARPSSQSSTTAASAGIRLRGGPSSSARACC